LKMSKDMYRPHVVKYYTDVCSQYNINSAVMHLAVDIWNATVECEKKLWRANNACCFLVSQKLLDSSFVFALRELSLVFCTQAQLILECEENILSALMHMDMELHDYASLMADAFDDETKTRFTWLFDLSAHGGRSRARRQ